MPGFTQPDLAVQLPSDGRDDRMSEREVAAGSTGKAVVSRLGAVPARLDVNVAAVVDHRAITVPVLPFVDIERLPDPKWWFGGLPVSDSIRRSRSNCSDPR